jgi:aspartyl aminopeptidase
MPEKETDELKKKLFYNPKNGYDRLQEGEQERIVEFASGYTRLMNEAKTEREFTAAIRKRAEEAGFSELVFGKVLAAGDRVYRVNREKSIMLAVIGKEPLSAGTNIFAAHIDSPRLDLKPSPLSEEGGLTFLKTHYYGGVKKYQWVAIPLELRGSVCLRNGKTININVGAGKSDPVFTITDLLPQSCGGTAEKNVGRGIAGESLAPVVGSIPYAADKEATERIKLQTMKLLNDKYGIIEEDFLCAELSFVPAFPARDLGFDRSLIAAYGHDDRCCAYCCAMGVLNTGYLKKQRFAYWLTRKKSVRWA